MDRSTFTELGKPGTENQWVQTASLFVQMKAVRNFSCDQGKNSGSRANREVLQHGLEDFLAALSRER